MDNEELQSAAKKYLGFTTPFVIKLTNISGRVQNNVNFLNAISSIGATNDGVTAGVTPSSGYSGATYKGILNLLLTGDFNMCAFYIYTTTNNQAIQSIKFEDDNQRGDFGGTTLMPDIMIDQKQTGLAYIEKDIPVSKYTKATLASMEVGAVYTIKMYFSERTTNSGLVIQSDKPTFTIQKKPLQ